jgi:hypothetical protein
MEPIRVYVLVAIAKKELGLEKSFQRNLANSQPDAFRENPYFASVERGKIARLRTTVP